MNKVKQFLLIAWLLPGMAMAQQRYAVLLGVNNYYTAPGTLSGHSLKGCVNDARAVGSLLTGRFGFPKKNIRTLFDSAVTRAGVIATLEATLAACRGGDACVFYYSGHGVWADNTGANIQDPVKRGYAQALVMSNLYEENMDCLLFDETLKSYFNRFIEKGVIVTAIYDCCFSGNLDMATMFSYWIPGDIPRTDKAIDWHVLTGLLTGGDQEKAFALEQKLTVSLKPGRRPSDIPNSRFLSLSATADNERGIDMSDDRGVRHGAFTRALLEVYRRQPATLPVSTLFQQLTALMKNQDYSQTPKYHCDEARLGGNLTGTSPSGFTNELRAQALTTAQQKLTINKGLLDGVSKGNIFSVGNGTATVTAALTESATLLLPAGIRISTGALLTRKDAYTESEPMVRLFIPARAAASGTWRSFFEQEVQRISGGADYRDYDSWAITNSAIALDLTGKNSTSVAFGQTSIKAYTYALLPLPEPVARELRSRLQPDQNILLVKSPDEADFVLYGNYVTAKKDAPAHFVYYFRPPLKAGSDWRIFSADTADVQELPETGKPLDQFCGALYSLARKTIRYKSNNWMNLDARRR